MSLDDRPKNLQWSPLTCKNAPDNAKLYYEFSRSTAGIFLAVTDLRFVWEASLRREEVVNEAQEQNCSIDPSESPAQLRTLLTKLEQSLTEGQNDLGQERDLVRRTQSLSLRTRLKLPAPLKLLTWKFHLQQQDSVRLAETVTFPLLSEAALMRRRMQTLFQVIKDKDHVLSKLLDKIDNSAIDLSLIFPGITGMKSRKQRVGVSEASKHVPGMATFDRTSWESGRANDHDGNSDGSTSFSSVLKTININNIKELKAKDWTKRLPKADESPMIGTVSDSEPDDATHTVARSQHKQPPDPKSDKSSSATESDFENFIDTFRRQRQRIERVNNPGSSPSARGALAAKSLSGSPIPADDLLPPPRKRDLSNSISESDSDHASRRATTQSKKSTSKIGILGGKRKASQAARSLSPPPISSKASTPSRKLGVLGGLRATAKSPSKSPVPSRARSNTPKVLTDETDSDTASNASPRPISLKGPKSPSIKSATPAPVSEEPAEAEKNVEDKAKRKREELKRSQAQANAGLAKKKARRF